MATIMTLPLDATVKEVREAIPVGSRERSIAKGVSLFLLGVVVYCGTFLGICLPISWPARLAAAVVNGLAIGIMFIIGHDACHGSLTARPALNRLLARLAFLPSLHPYLAWQHSHNSLHHGWTNLRGKDPVYCPLSIDEYRALPRWKQRLERVYRSWLGILPLYLIEIWWRLEIAPAPHHRAAMAKRGSFALDRALVLAFPFIQAAVAVYAATSWQATLTESALIAIVAAVLPFLTFNWLIGFATFQHHTHPRVVWYDDASEWNFFRAQVQGTVHIQFPRWLEMVFHNIMEHTAHHVDTKVPLYNLTNAQDALEEAYGSENVIVENFSFSGMNNTFRQCQLYDYATHQWLSFDGTPTTEIRNIALEGQTASIAASASSGFSRYLQIP